MEWNHASISLPGLTYKYRNVLFSKKHRMKHEHMPNQICDLKIQFLFSGYFCSDLGPFNLDKCQILDGYYFISNKCLDHQALAYKDNGVLISSNNDLNIGFPIDSDCLNLDYINDLIAVPIAEWDISDIDQWLDLNISVHINKEQ